MADEGDYEPAGPAQFLEKLNDGCDLDAAFDTLEGFDHFYSCALRGRTRTLQLRPEEAEAFFAESDERYPLCQPCLRNSLRRFYVKVYRYENQLLLESSSPDEFEAELRRRAEDLRDDPYAVEREDTRMGQPYLWGHYLLHRQQYREAFDVFNEIMRPGVTRIIDNFAGLYIMAAAAARQLGLEDEAQKHVQSAALMIPVLRQRFNMGLFAGMLVALLRLWKHDREADGWLQFLVDMKVPEKTRLLFLERSRRIIAKSVELERVYLF